MSTALINGVSAEHLNINDRAIHYGDGLFETILCSDNRLLYWPQHYQRLQLSAEKLRLNCPDEQVLLNDISRLLKQNENISSAACSIKIIVTRGSGERGYVMPKKARENRIIFLSQLSPEYSSLLSGQLSSGELYLCNQQVSINEDLAGLKHLNRLENVLARNEWQQTAANKFIDGLMLNANKHVIEGTMSNLFAVRDGHLYTPDLSLSGVRGIMRDIIIAAAQRNGIQLSSLDLTLEDLSAMDEIFISNSLIGMSSVNRIGDNQYQRQAVTELIFNDLLKTKEDHVQIVQ